jgi:hypothetical protein
MKPTIGRIVHFVQKKPEGYGDTLVHLPAIIVAVWGDTCVNLQVFTDGTNSDVAETNRVKWVTSVTLDETVAPQPRTWHWPEHE